MCVKMCMDTHRTPLSDFTEEPAVRLCSRGRGVGRVAAMTPKEHGRLHRSAIVSAGKWVAVKAAEELVWAALPSQLMLQGRVQPQLEMEIFSQVILRSVCCMALEFSFSHVQSHQTHACCRQKGHLGPSPGSKVQVMKPTACSAWAEAGLTALYWWASFLVGRFREKRRLKLENLTVLVSSPTTTLEVVWLERRVQ